MRIENEDDREKVFLLAESLYGYVPIKYSGIIRYYKNKLLYTRYGSENNGESIRSTKRIKKNHGKINITGIDYKQISRYFDESLITKVYKFKVIDFKKSAKLFGFSGIKKEMVGKTFDASRVDHLVDVKKSTERENTVTLILDGRNIRFSIDDLKVITPNINGWSIKKDKTITSGDIALIIKNKGIRSVSVGQKCNVREIKRIGDKKYALISVNGKNVYSSLRNLKLINNDKAKEEAVWG
jgi:hypothetical protein